MGQSIVRRKIVALRAERGLSAQGSDGYTDVALLIASMCRSEDECLQVAEFANDLAWMFPVGTDRTDPKRRADFPRYFVNEE